MKPKVCVLRTDGTNCDTETAYAFNKVGGDAEIVHINSFKKGYDPIRQQGINLDQYHILAIPGGFSHGDYIAAGKVLALDLMQSLGEEIKAFIDSGKPVIGICNGFQVLVKSGLLPGESYQRSTLTYNDSGNFECRWVKLISPENKCIWTKGVESLDVPVAHGEGKFVTDDDTLMELMMDGQLVYQYADTNGGLAHKFPDNPNGSYKSIAGICDPTGLVFGLMPHPERYNHPNNHHLASLQRILSRDYVDRDDPAVKKRLELAGEYPKEGKGLQIFRNGIDYVVENLLGGDEK